MISLMDLESAAALMLEPIKTLDLSKGDYSVDTTVHHDY